LRFIFLKYFTSSLHEERNKRKVNAAKILKAGARDSIQVLTGKM
jgi:hypothetical protein